jgi:hypothetical protein
MDIVPEAVSFYIPGSLTDLTRFVADNDPFRGSLGTAVFTDQSTNFQKERAEDNIPVYN